LLGYAITSMELATYHSAQDILLGASPTELARWETSLDRLVTPSAPPMFRWPLSAAGRPHALHVFTHGPHSLGLAMYPPTPTTDIGPKFWALDAVPRLRPGQRNAQQCL
jgi:hypothetical protein